jgi:hypothetical protein
MIDYFSGPEFYTANVGEAASEESNYQDVPTEVTVTTPHSTVENDSPKPYSFDINASVSLQKTPSDLCKSIEDLFEMSDEIENVESYSSDEGRKNLASDFFNAF